MKELRYSVFVRSSDMTPTKQGAHETEQQRSPKRLAFPVLTIGKNRRNPSFKQRHFHSPTKNLTVSS